MYPEELDGSDESPKSHSRHADQKQNAQHLTTLSGSLGPC
jgi:hypothetical protein